MRYGGEDSDVGFYFKFAFPKFGKRIPKCICVVAWPPWSGRRWASLIMRTLLQSSETLSLGCLESLGNTEMSLFQHFRLWCIIGLF